jgi:hypothetical protein
MKLDVSKMQPKAAAAPVKAPPFRPTVFPPDDPAWVAKLKSLPANTWVRTKPEREVFERSWSNTNVDPVRGHYYCFGGGHGGRNLNDVSVYVTGANVWLNSVADADDLIPPVLWSGYDRGLRGGACAHHQRNTYTAMDGRLYYGAIRDALIICDIDRGGIWRELRVTRTPGSDPIKGLSHRSFPDGRLVGFLGHSEPFHISRFWKHKYPGVSVLDVYTGRLTCRKVSEPSPGKGIKQAEGQPFCLMPDKGEKGQAFYVECAYGRNKKALRTMLYDFATNTWKDLKPERNPPGSPSLVMYIAGQDAVLCSLHGSKKVQNEVWAYSFKRNAWAPFKYEGNVHCAQVYGQAGYVAKYGVIVSPDFKGMNSISKTAVMRPDLSKVKW